MSRPLDITQEDKDTIKESSTLELLELYELYNNCLPCTTKYEYPYYKELIRLIEKEISTRGINIKKEY